MAKTIVNETNTAEADVVIVSAPYDKTTSSHKGTAQGPEAVINQLNSQIEFFDRKFKTEPNEFVKIAHENLDIEHLSPEEALGKINSLSEKLLSQNKFVFLLGGEHSVSIGLFQALAKKYDPKDVTILQVDAHCDLRKDDSDYSDNPSPLAHSTVMRHASELGFPLVQVGIRTYSKDEYEYFSDPAHNVTVFEWNKEQIPVEKIIDSIRTKFIYITIDVDGFDPAYMPGTGTPVQGGLSWYYGLDLIERAIEKAELVSADIVEVSPQEDTTVTEYGAAELVYSIIANRFQDKFTGLK